jgi:hypothetical protein
VKSEPPLFKWTEDLYGTALNYYQAFCDRVGWALLPFPYNWTQDNRQSAEDLFRFLTDRADEGMTDFILVAHSMGGVVGRILLSDPRFESINQRVSMLFQIGTPVLGSIKALYTLKVRPELNRVLDLIVRRLRTPETHHQLMMALGSLPALFQLLPPSSESVLIDDYGNQLSSFDSRLWGELHAALIDRAHECHQLSCPLRDERIRGVIGTGILTSHGYRIDSDGRIKEGLTPFVYGDGTVTARSSSHGLNQDSMFAVTDNVGHDALVAARSVCEYVEHHALRSLKNKVGQ